jgi:HEAT repeat protein
MTHASITITAVLLLVAAPAAQQARFDDVVRNLRNPDARVRLSSIEMLRESKYLEAIEPIAPLVIDPVDEIQLAAIEAELSFFTVEELGARKRMAFIIERRSSGQAETVFASGPLAVWPRRAPDALLTNLLQAVDDEHPKVRMEAIYTFGAIAQAPLSEAHTRAVVRALDHYDPAIRHAAARVAGRLDVTPALEMLVKAVFDSQEAVRFAAMRALGEIGAESTVKTLAEQMEHYGKGEGAWSALDALARIGHEASVPLFTARLADRDQYIRAAALEGLGRALSIEASAMADGAIAQIQAIETAAAGDSSPVVRAAAAFALERLGKGGIDRLVAAFDTDRLAPQVAGYLLELGSKTAPALVPHLKDPQPSIRGNVAVVLGAIGSSADIAALEPLLQERDADVRRSAERAIQRIKVRGV